MSTVHILSLRLQSLDNAVIRARARLARLQERAHIARIALQAACPHLSASYDYNYYDESGAWLCDCCKSRLSRQPVAH